MAEIPEKGLTSLIKLKIGLAIGAICAGFGTVIAVVLNWDKISKYVKSHLSLPFKKSAEKLAAIPDKIESSIKTTQDQLATTTKQGVSNTSNLVSKIKDEISTSTDKVLSVNKPYEITEKTSTPVSTKKAIETAKITTMIATPDLSKLKLITSPIKVSNGKIKVSKKTTSSSDVVKKAKDKVKKALKIF